MMRKTSDVMWIEKKVELVTVYGWKMYENGGQMSGVGFGVSFLREHR